MTYTNTQDRLAWMALILLTLTVLTFGLLAIGTSGASAAQATVDGQGIGPDIGPPGQTGTISEQVEQDDPDPRESDDGNNSWTQKELEHQLGDLDIRATEWLKTDDSGFVLRIWLEWTGRAPETVTVTQVPSDGESFSISQRRLKPDEQTMIELDVLSKEMALLYTDSSLSRERGIQLKPNNDNQTETSLLRGVSIGMLVFGLATGVNAYRRQRMSGKPAVGWS